MVLRVELSVLVIGIALLIVGAVVGDSASVVFAIGMMALVVGVVSVVFYLVVKNARREVVIGGLVIGLLVAVGGIVWQILNPDGILTVYIAPLGVGLVLSAVLTLADRAKTAHA